MSKTMTIVALVAVVIIAIGGYLYPKVGASLFGSTSCGSITCLSGGLRLVSDAGGDFETDIVSVFGATSTMANVVVTTSNTATSSVQSGCFQTVATSTATPIKIIIGAANTAASSTFGTASGFVVWGFGKCPGV